MHEWNEYHRRIAEWRKTNATPQLRMDQHYRKSGQQGETNPEFGIQVLEECIREAQRLHEPWWVLFYELRRLDSISAGLHDFARALPLAQELMVRFASPEGQAHAFYDSTYTAILYTFLSIDPVGYSRELERGFAALDARIPKAPMATRFRLDFRRAQYLSKCERYEESLDLVMRSYASTDFFPTVSERPFHKAWHLFLVCPLCHTLGRLDELEAHARQMEENARPIDHLKQVVSAAQIWQAVALRARGETVEAARAFHEGLRHLNNVSIRDEVCADQVATYYELAGEWPEALGVRDKQLAEVERKGMLHEACKVSIERCKLLAKLGTLAPADVNRARNAAARLRVPAWHFERLARVMPDV